MNEHSCEEVGIDFLRQLANLEGIAVDWRRAFAIVAECNAELQRLADNYGPDRTAMSLFDLVSESRINLSLTGSGDWCIYATDLGHCFYGDSLDVAIEKAANGLKAGKSGSEAAACVLANPMPLVAGGADLGGEGGAE